MIHEGTNGIQSLDLLGRKLPSQGGRGLKLLLAEVQAAVDKALRVPVGEGTTQLHSHAEQLAEAAKRLAHTSQTLLHAGSTPGQGPAVMMANSHEYLNMAGHVVIAWRWLEMETAATEKMTEAGDELTDDFLRGQQVTARYFFRHELPKIYGQAALLESLDDTTLLMKDEYF